MYLTMVSTAIVVKFPAIFFSDSEQPSTEIGFTGK
jgi:hypothetical protein